MKENKHEIQVRKRTFEEWRNYVELEVIKSKSKETI